VRNVLTKDKLLELFAEFLLEAIGGGDEFPYRDCVGALQFLPNGVTPEPAGTVKRRPIDSDYIARMKLRRMGWNGLASG
jgi:hypothetical protein